MSQVSIGYEIASTIMFAFLFTVWQRSSALNAGLKVAFLFLLIVGIVSLYPIYGPYLNK